MIAHLFVSKMFIKHNHISKSMLADKTLSDTILVVCQHTKTLFDNIFFSSNIPKADKPVSDIIQRADNSVSTNIPKVDNSVSAIIPKANKANLI